MKNLTFLLLLSLVLSFGCKEDEEPALVCGTADPVANLPWLNTFAKELNDSYYGVYFYVTAGTYQDQQVFLIKNCCPNCNTITLVYACGGEVLGSLGRDGVGIDATEIKDEVIIWRGTGFACTV